MQNPDSKFILAIKTFNFCPIFKIVAGPVATNSDPDAEKKIFPCLPAVKCSRQKFIISGQFLHLKNISFVEAYVV